MRLIVTAEVELDRGGDLLGAKERVAMALEVLGDTRVIAVRETEVFEQLGLFSPPAGRRR